MFTENRWSKQFFCSVRVWLFMRDQMYFLLFIIHFIDHTDGRGRFLPQEWCILGTVHPTVLCYYENAGHEKPNILASWLTRPSSDELRAKRQKSSVLSPPPPPHTYTFFYQSIYKHVPVQFLLILIVNN